MRKDEELGRDLLSKFVIGREAPYVDREFTKFIGSYFSGRTDLIGLELGVWKGENAETICTYLGDKLKCLVLLDSWETSGELREAQINHYLETYFMFEGKANVITVKGWSVLVSKLFGRIFDFIYVDGNHCYADFNMDLKSWYPLVKVGGVFGGHDYTQVKDALVNFFRDKPENYEVRELDWWIIKEE